MTRTALLWITLSGVLGCTHVKIHDSEWCGTVPTGGGTCAHTLVPGSRNLSPDAWEVERAAMFCTSPETFADWKRVIEQLCSASKACDYDTRP